MKPAGAGLGYRVVPKGGDTLSGYYVPEGTLVGYNWFGLFASKQLWGDDADIFRPERFLEGSQQEIRRKDGMVEMIFSYGKWQCLGKNVAMVELNKVFVEVCCSYFLVY
jgi:cytochrome P450